MQIVNQYLITVFVSYFLVSLFFSVLINGLFLKFARSLGIRNLKDNGIRWGAQNKPSLGGISFFIIFLFSITAYSIFFEQSQYFLNIKFIGIVFVSTLGFMMGLYDDAFDTKPLIKLSTQILCGVILILTDTYIQIFELEWLNYVVTLFWVVGIMNSINMLDNMDAISSIVAIFILITILVLHDNLSSPFIILIIGVLASLIGFLFYNWHPSRMYMGDTGSQFIGVFLAVMGILYLWNGNDVAGLEIKSKQFITLLLVFLLPLVDTTTVFVNRIKSGKSPFVGGKDHTTHHLSRLIGSDKLVALIFAGISLVSMVLVFIVYYSNHWNIIYILSFSIYLLLVFVVLFYIANRKEE